MNEVNLIVVCRALLGRERELRAELEAVVEPVRKEHGCIAYNLYVSKDDPAEFYFVETWVDQVALESHFVTKENKSFVERINKLMVGGAKLSRLGRLA